MTSGQSEVPGLIERYSDRILPAEGSFPQEYSIFHVAGTAMCFYTWIYYRYCQHMRSHHPTHCFFRGSDRLCKPRVSQIDVDEFCPDCQTRSSHGWRIRKQKQSEKVLKNWTGIRTARIY